MNKDETGRSLVEMLGMLAIIGVLSVAGIAGYTSLMNKHRANELFNEASKRAAVVAMQIASGKTAPETANNTLIGEFTDPAGHVFTVGKANENQFNIEITLVSKDVCEQMKALKGGVIKGFSPDTCTDDATVKLTYNNDMSIADTTPHTPSCALTITDCPNGVDTTNCVCETTSACLDDTSTIKCLSNTEDENGNSITLCSGYYCKVGGSCKQQVHTVTAGDITALPSQPISKDDNGYHKGGTMTWDAAYYYCQALKARGDITSGMAEKENVNELPLDLVYWVNSLIPNGSTPTSSTSCTAYIMDGYDYITNTGRSASNTHALCK